MKLTPCCFSFAAKTIPIIYLYGVVAGDDWVVAEDDSGRVAGFLADGWDFAADLFVVE